ncbi:hypothetical protein BBJ28_00006079 [Nothophytophthora sp. Chile5]|nr:hypothetical protein BBJ28_00006079 [Nothophytophthora sp. Chile5]
MTPNWRKIPVAPLLRLAVLLMLHALDVLDLYSKLFWIGPTDSYSFSVLHEEGFSDEPLPRPAFLATANASSLPLEPGSELLRLSGWTSYYEKCSDLIATKQNQHFHMIKAINCELSAASASEPIIARELVLSAGLRADSVAWVSCQLLFFHRRPPICQENVVTQFPERYRIAELEPTREQMAAINSQAEVELWKMLGLLSRSHPLAAMVCSEGFQSMTGPGRYPAAVFICGSANVFESAIVGVHASSFAELHAGLAWLTVDKLNIMGFELVTRQNSRSEFTLREEDGALVVAQQSAVNFATFGHLYVVLVITDIVLLISHARAAYEATRAFGWRSLLGFPRADSDGDRNRSSANWMVLYRSLYRSDGMVALTMLSGLLSWPTTFPYAVIWAWNDHWGGKALALVSIFRVWMLVICSLNVLWGVCVRIAEARAYKVVKCTFVTPLEVLLSTALVVSLQAGTLFNAVETSRELDRQRVVDSEAFSRSVAFANTYNEDLDGFATTSPETLRVIFNPLIAVVMESLALIVLLLVAKALHYRGRTCREDTDRVAATNSTAVGDLDITQKDALLNRSTDQRSLLRHAPAKRYHRLPIEELLRAPARANSMVRSSFDMEEISEDYQTYIRPHLKPARMSVGESKKAAEAAPLLPTTSPVLTSPKAEAAPKHHALLGIACVACSALCFSLMSTFIKYETYTFSSMEAIFWRSVGAFVCNFVRGWHAQ